MSTVEFNEQDGWATAARRDLAEQWHRKGRFWSRPAIFLGAPHLVLLPLQFAVKDDFWSVVILAAAVLCLAIQLPAIARMHICYRRAKAIRIGGAR